MGTTSNLLKPLGLVVLCLLLAGITRGGTVSMDGSLPGSVSISGATYTISAGRQSGANQFYSFQQLNLVLGDVASFTTPMGVSNVIARVTGGQSSIDGTISVPNASFYLINNQGVIFGPDASLNVGGAFVVTTADELKFADGKVFTATPSGSDATLSTAAPSAFGFLSSSPQGVTINGTSLTTNPSQNIDIVSGPLNITNGTNASATITTFGGQINIASVGSAGEVDLSSSGVSIPSGSFTQMGTVDIESSVLNTVPYTPPTGPPIPEGPGGNVTIDAGNLTINGSQMITGVEFAIGSSNSGSVSLSGNSITYENGFIRTDTNAAGNAGAVSITAAGDLTINNGQILADTSNAITAAGQAGDITLMGNNITIENVPNFLFLGGINTDVNGGSEAGTIRLTATGVGPSGGDITVSNSTIDATTEGPNFSPAITGGPIVINALSLEVLDGAMIVTNTNTESESSAGNITVTVGSLTIDGTGPEGSTLPTGISSAAVGTQRTGNAGTVQINAGAGSVLVQNGGFISTSSEGAYGVVFTSGAAGTITIQAGSLTVQNGASIQSNTETQGAGGVIMATVTGGPVLLNNGSITTETSLTSTQAAEDNITAGNAGTVMISGGSLTVSNGGQISSTTFGQGSAGQVAVGITNALNITGNDVLGSTGIFSESSQQGTGGGNAGNVTVSSGSLSLANAGEISTNTSTTGIAGTVVVNSATSAGPVTINSGSSVNSASSESGAAGSISIFAKSFTLEDHSSVSSAATGSGAAGAVSLTVLNGGNATVSNGSSVVVSSANAGAGDITLDAMGGEIQVLNNSSITASAGTIDANQSAEADSVSENGGKITLTTPSLLQVSDSTISAQAEGAGGSITIDPDFVILNNSVLQANAVFGNGGLIEITANDGFFNSSSAINASSAFGLQGTFALTTPQLDLTGGLVALSGSLADISAQLEPTCAMFAGRNSSTLIESSNGGLPLQPGGWNPSPMPGDSFQGAPVR